MNVPFFALDAIGSAVDVRAAVQRVMASRRYILGPEVERFERAFAEYCGTAHSLGVASGTDALELALRALEIGPGQAVATVANAGPYSGTAIRAVGATPVYVEVDPTTLAMSPHALRTALAEHELAAVIVTHLYGRLADMATLVATTDEAGIPLIEDAAQAHGAARDRRRAGSFGRLGCFSFYPTKNLGAIGDGGAITTDDDELARRVRALRQYGWSSKYRSEVPGGRNSRLDELQAAVLADRLPHLDAWNDERRAIADRYLETLDDLPLTLPPAPDDDDVKHLFVVRTPDRAALREHLTKAGIGTEVHFPVADHRQPAWATADAPHLPVTEEACDSVLSLPCYPGLSAEAQDAVIAAVVRAAFADATAPTADPTP